MKKARRRLPELERLETMFLLSTVSAEAHQAAKAVAPAGPIQLVGTFSVKSVKPPASAGSTAEAALVGRGNLAKFGRALIIASETSSPESPGEFEVFISKQGVGVYSAQTTLPAKGATITLPYSADNQGEWYLPSNINLTGTISISNVVAKNGKSSYMIKLS
jgi:hypothetical protein